jgi:uncharacterized membrane protein
MNWAHLHLMLNHVPVLGTVFGLGLLVWGMLRRNESVQRAALATFGIAAIVAIPVYLTGEPAESAVEHLAGTTEAAIEAHEEAALISLISLEIVGLIAFAGMVLRKVMALRVATRAALVLSLVTAGLMARTANLGGRIRHAEIGASAASGGEHESGEGSEGH